jgi:coatomer subunit beta
VWAAGELEAAAAAARVQADELIKVRQLRARRGGELSDADDGDDVDLSRATGAAELLDAGLESKLNRIVQLTGFSDPIFAEAYVTVHQYDIVLEVTMVNQTGDTLQNVCLELATLGDLKLVTHTLCSLARLITTINYYYYYDRIG